MHDVNGIQGRANRQRGHTLVELMIAMMLGLVVTGGAVSLYRSQRQAFTQAADAASMRDAGMTALMLIGQQVQMAGFVPIDTVPSGSPASPDSPAIVPALFGCSGARPVGAGGTPNCELLASRSDGIVVRYVGDAVSTWPTTAGHATDCLGQGVGSAGAAEPIVNRYYARLSGSTGEPELYCEGSGRGRVGQPLVEGIERLRFKYWLQGASSPVAANLVAAGQWSNVVAVDICVLARGALTRRRTRYVDCDGTTVLAADRHARQAFWRRVAVRNNEPVPSS